MVNNTFNTFTSLEIYPSDLCLERKQVRFPKSKKNRIRAKWSKREENYKYIPKTYQIGDKIFCHTSFYNRFKKEF